MKKFGSYGISWLVLGLVGLFLIFFQRPLKNILYIVVGIGMLGSAVAGIFAWFQDRSRSAGSVSEVVTYVVLALLGLWILTHRYTFDRLINMVIGMLMIVSGVSWLIRNNGFEGGRLIALLAVIGVVLGLVVMTAGVGTTWILTAAGIALVYCAVSGWLSERAL